MSLPKLAFVGTPQAVSPWLMHALRRHAVFEAICGDEPERDAAKYQARWAFTDAESLLREAEPVGVVLSVPVRQRARLARMCVAAGAGVLVAGVPCRSAESRRLSLYAKLAGRCILGASPICYSPAFLLALRLIESGRCGRPVSMTVTSTRRGSPHADVDAAGSIPVDQTLEAVELLHALVGPLQEVCGFEHEDGVLAASGRTQSSAAFSIVLHACGPIEAVGTSVELRASDGTILRLERDCRLWCGNGSRFDAAHLPTLSASDPSVELGFDGLVSEFVRLLRAGQPTGLLGPAAEVLVGVDALQAGARRGRTVRIKGPTLDPKPSAQFQSTSTELS